MTDDVSQETSQDVSQDATAAPAPSGDAWVPVASTEELAKKRRIVVDTDAEPVLVINHEGRLCAFANICIHKERELTKGVVLNGKIVCPGHQWAFALDTGWEAVKERSQPTYVVEERDGHVWLDTASRAERSPAG